MVTRPWGLGRVEPVPAGRVTHASTFYSIVEVLDCIGRCQAAIAKVGGDSFTKVEREGLRQTV